MSKHCVINNVHCMPRSCVHCAREFCPHEHPDHRAFGDEGQFCTRECEETKYLHIFACGAERFPFSRVVLVVEQEYCYLVCNQHRSAGSKGVPGYGFKILHESAKSSDERRTLDYCHFPGFSIKDYPIPYRMHRYLQIAIEVIDEYNKSMWTMVGFRLLDGEIDTYGVGGHIEVIDLRK